MGQNQAVSGECPTILVEKSYTEGNFAKALNNADCHIIEADTSLNNLIKETASEKNIKCISTNVLCSECFDYYIEDLNILLNRLPKDVNITAAEMESFALFYTAKYLNKKASCLLTVVDSHCKNQKISADEREKSLNDMITLALESALKIYKRNAYMRFFYFVIDKILYFATPTGA